MTNLDRHYFANKGPSSQSYVFSSSHVWMWEQDHKESLALKNWCFWTVVLEKNPESPLDCKQIQPVNPEGNQSWVYFGRTDSEAETPIPSPPDAKELAHWKRPWCWERLKAGGEGDDRGWAVWIASPSQWPWVEQAPGVGDTGKPGVLQATGSQKVRHYWSTKLNWKGKKLITYMEQ